MGMIQVKDCKTGDEVRAIAQQTRERIRNRYRPLPPMKVTGADKTPESEPIRVIKPGPTIEALVARIEMLERKLAPILAAPDPIYPSMAEIQLAVCQFYGVELRELKSLRRTGALVRARHVAIYLCRELTAKSMPEIGRAFDHRDHTTICSAYHRIANLRKNDSELNANIGRLTIQILGDGNGMDR